MGKSNVIELEGRDIAANPLTVLLRTGFPDLIDRAVEAELAENPA